MRKKEQNVMGFYIWKNTQKKQWEVGKNGTSKHTTIPFGKHAKLCILGYILNDGVVNNG